jgi:hypothetical protein
VALVAALTGANAQAQDKAAYEQRSIARYVELFTWLDGDRDGTVTLRETQGDLNFTPVFNDIDINRDGIVTKAELDRYLELQYGMRRG